MTFPRKPDNSLDFDTYNTYNRPLQKEAALELKRNGTPAEHKQAAEYFTQKANENRVLQAEQHAYAMHRVQQEQKKMDKEIDELASQVAHELINDRKKSKCSIS